MAAGRRKEGRREATLAAKIHDLALLYKAYQDNLNNFGLDSEDYLGLAAAKSQNCSFLEKASIWIDSFAGFTPHEYSLLKN